MQHKGEYLQPCNCKLNSKRHKQVNEKAKEGEKKEYSHADILSEKL